MCFKFLPRESSSFSVFFRENWTILIINKTKIKQTAGKGIKQISCFKFFFYRMTFVGWLNKDEWSSVSTVFWKKISKLIQGIKSYRYATKLYANCWKDVRHQSKENVWEKYLPTSLIKKVMLENFSKNKILKSSLLKSWYI